MCVYIHKYLDYAFVVSDFGSGEERVRKLETKVFIGKTSTGKARTELTTVSCLVSYVYLCVADLWLHPSSTLFGHCCVPSVHCYDIVCGCVPSVNCYAIE